MQWDGTLESIQTICDWSNGDRSDEPWVDYLTSEEYSSPFNVLVHTPEGAERVRPNDWIVRVEGEFYLCTAENFEKKYEVINA